MVHLASEKRSRTKENLVYSLPTIKIHDYEFKMN